MRKIGSEDGLKKYKCEQKQIRRGVVPVKNRAPEREWEQYVRREAQGKMNERRRNKKKEKQMSTRGRQAEPRFGSGRAGAGALGGGGGDYIVRNIQEAL